MPSDASPQLAMTNLFEDGNTLRSFALEHAFDGIEWSFDLETLSKTPAEQSRWVREMHRFEPLDVRFHCPFVKIDLGHDDPARAAEAEEIFRGIVRLVSKAGGGILSIHIGLGRDSTEPLSWDATLTNLRNLVQYGSENRVRVCLENLAWGWTSRPNLFEKIVRMSGAGVTLDIGHAQACESVRSQEYTVEDFVTPHPDRVLGAHVYHVEVEGKGHIPPRRLQDVASRLDLLREIGCPWWTLELHDPDALLQARDVVAQYLETASAPPRSAGKRASS